MSRLDVMAYVLADRACIADVECHAVAVRDAGQRWWDVRPMTDPRELCDDSIEMNAQALAYLEARGLLTRHPQHAHLVRIAMEDQP